MLGRGAAAVVRAYQKTLSRALPPRCRFHPSCSEYAVGALRANGLAVGGAQALWRVVRCGPWHPGGVDYPKPRRRRPGRRASSVIHPHG